MPTKAERQAAPLTLYVTRYCHLCTEMELELVRWQRELDFTFEIVDVDQDPELDQEYGERVPVLAAASAEICAGRLDPGQLKAALARPQG